LSRQRRDNSLVGKHLGELDHASQGFLREPAAVLALELLRERDDHLLAVGGTGMAEHASSVGSQAAPAIYRTQGWTDLPRLTS